MYNLSKVRKDFPILQRKFNGKSLIYFDSAATSQKPQQVIESISDYYSNSNANIHRGIHFLAEEATSQYEAVREQSAKFINAKLTKEIIFVRNTTEAINLVAQSYGHNNVKKNDEIVTTIMEHHSNFVPWQRLAKEREADFKVIDIDEDLSLSQSLSKEFSKRTKILAIAHVSNVLGTINPIKQIIKDARKINPNIIVVVDGAQAVPHLAVDVQDLDCDFYAFSGHKMLGPMGVGALYGKQRLLETMPPFLTGGGMIKEVAVTETGFSDLPEKFEAGTPDVAAVVGLGEAIKYIETLGVSSIKYHVSSITAQLISELETIPEVTIYGGSKSKERVGVVSFNVSGIHAHDVAQFLNDKYNIAVRAGHHCAMPLHQRLGVQATVRASLYLYNTEEEIVILIKAIRELIGMFK